MKTNPARLFARFHVHSKILLLCLALCMVVPPACSSRKNGALQYDPQTGFNTSARLQAHIKALVAIGPRCLEKKGSLTRAANYIGAQLRAMGYSVQQEAFPSHGQQVTNIEVVKHGGLNYRESVVAVAHYDTVKQTPGADDNGSGVAALLEIARLAQLQNFKRSLRFVFTVNEELPGRRGKEKGAVRRARQARTQREKVHAVLVVDSVGYYADAPASQNSTVLNEFATDKGNFLAFVTLNRKNNKAILPVVAQYFSEKSPLPVRTAALGWGSWPYYSDLRPFTDMGYTTVLATDTGPLRNPHYHKDSDTPETLDAKRLVEATQGVAGVLYGLALE
ncbi:MAG: M20/M25/M40 family metallo-hydrolase [Desulfovibrio sp.]|uniref:M20/M25/M40 family metallo-hydrolase n=1 Tax=Desulfovibrio sp. 7SRBS1 TaxID=3378064 RepID=UPI003B408857